LLGFPHSLLFRLEHVFPDIRPACILREKA
jgi:hypothetical protein